ncbi:MAG TPA: AarF/UbiB family protein [Pyrinomonadaceae bacterium]|nr:AarF/UbiB family protein [Pyrinomonadaceae bacterium]
MVARFLEILFLTVRHGTAFCVRAAYLCASGRRDECARAFGESLAALCESLGPTFIKVGQILSSRPDLLPDGVGPPLVRLQDQIAPFDSEQIPGIIESAFGRPLNELFESFDLAPVASASIAQVHRARLKDGREVAVKIRRPGISRVVNNDIRILESISRALVKLPGMRAVPIVELVDDIQLPIRQQLDFHLEAANNRRFREAFARSEHIKFPELVEHLCTEDVLTMEYLDHLRRTDSANLTADERKTAALAGLRALYKMIFIDGLIHADMHPGNVFIREFGEFVILDTGLVANLDEKDRRDFVDFFFGLVNNESRECARIILDNASYRAKNCDVAGFEAAMVELIARHSALKSHEFEVALFVYQLIEIQRRFKIRGSTKFMMTILSMVVFDGICKRLYPLCDFQKESRAFLITARYKASKNPQPQINRALPSASYESQFVKWDELAYIRKKSRRATQFDRDLYFYPQALATLFAHPKVLRSPEHIRRELLVLHLYNFLEFTVRLELGPVNEVNKLLCDEDFLPWLPSQMRDDAFKIYIDEGAHAEMCHRLMGAVQEHTNVKRLRLTPAFLRTLEDLVASEEPEYRPFIKLFFVIISETLITGSLVKLPKDESVQKAVRDLANDHATDEGRHHAYFRKVFEYVWPRLPRETKRKVGTLLPDMMLAFLQPDKAGLTRMLELFPEEFPSPAQIVEEVVDYNSIRNGILTSASPTLKMFRENRVFEDPVIDRAFDRLRLAPPRNEEIPPVNNRYAEYSNHLARQWR